MFTPNAWRFVSNRVVNTKSFISVKFELACGRGFSWYITASHVHVIKLLLSVDAPEMTFANARNKQQIVLDDWEFASWDVAMYLFLFCTITPVDMEGTVWKVLYLNRTALEGTLLKFLYVECKVPGSYSTWNVLSLDDSICARFSLLKVLSQESTIQLIYCPCKVLSLESTVQVLYCSLKALYL